MISISTNWVSFLQLRTDSTLTVQILLSLAAGNVGTFMRSGVRERLSLPIAMHRIMTSYDDSSMQTLRSGMCSIRGVSDGSRSM